MIGTWNKYKHTSKYDKLTTHPQDPLHLFDGSAGKGKKGGGGKADTGGCGKGSGRKGGGGKCDKGGCGKGVGKKGGKGKGGKGKGGFDKGGAKDWGALNTPSDDDDEEREAAATTDPYEADLGWGGAREPPAEVAAADGGRSRSRSPVRETASERCGQGSAIQSKARALPPAPARAAPPAPRGTVGLELSRPIARGAPNSAIQSLAGTLVRLLRHVEDEIHAARTELARDFRT